MLRRIRAWARQRALSIFIFSYGIVVGTSAPIVIGRCASGTGGCANCAGFCGVALGVVPLLVVLAVRGRLRQAGRRLLSLGFRSVKRQDV